MREILFRGKRVDNGEWVYGYLLSVMGFHHIIPSGVGQVELDCPVDPDTVGQYTGLKDKEGVKIFEGDLLKDPDGDVTKCVVEWRCFGWYLVGYGIQGALMEYGFDEDKGEVGELFEETFNDHSDWYEVIGNIHETKAKIHE